MTNAKNTVPNARILAIDGLRGIAALGVLFVHIPHWPVGPLLQHPFGLFAVLFDLGRIGVPFFIVLSGYCIHRTTKNCWIASPKTNPNWYEFAIRRLHRLYIPYLVAILLGLVSIAYTVSLAEASKHLPLDTPCHMLLLQNILFATPNGVGNGPLWTIAMEAQLYLAYPVVFYAFRKIGMSVTLVSVFTLSLMWSAISLRPRVELTSVPSLQIGGWLNWVPQYWFLWCLGAYLAEYSERTAPQHNARHLRIAFLLFALGALTDYRILFIANHSTTLQSCGAIWLAITNSIPPENLNWICLNSFGAGFGFILLFCLKSPHACVTRLVSLFAPVGLFSYSLYLTHTPVLTTINHFLPTSPFSHDLTPWLRIYFVSVPCCLVFAWVYYISIEQHFRRKRLISN